MSYTYASKKKTDKAAPGTEAAAKTPSLDALRTGAARPTGEQMGHRVDLPDAMRAKMENAFGTDLGAVKLYESQAVADAGAEAVTRGSDIAFAPGMLDFSSYGGQALLGHEISHVVSQQRGEVSGSGFLNDRALESRADREGAMAASGQSVAMPAAAMSSVSAAPAAGPMQAKKPSFAERRYAKHDARMRAARGKLMQMGMDESVYHTDKEEKKRAAKRESLRNTMDYEKKKMEKYEGKLPNHGMYDYNFGY